MDDRFKKLPPGFVEITKGIIQDGDMIWIGYAEEFEPALGYRSHPVHNAHGNNDRVFRQINYYKYKVRQ